MASRKSRIRRKTRRIRRKTRRIRGGSNSNNSSTNSSNSRPTTTNSSSSTSNTSSGSGGIGSHIKNMIGMKGGGGSYSSGASYAEYVNGNSNAQFNRTMMDSQQPGNTIIGAQGQNTIPSTHMPTSNQLAAVQQAGRRRRRKGGFLGHVINNAIVPFGILGLQQTFGRKSSGHKRTHRYTH
jgi:hypothetical protein